MPENIYKEVERLKAEQAASAPYVHITDSYRWSGKLESIPALIAALRFAGLSSDLQIKLVTLTGALRISDYTTRATCQPGECFWLEGDKICSGDHADWQQAREKNNAAVAGK